MFKRCFSTIKTSQYVQHHDRKSASVIQLNRPNALNAINLEMFDAIHQLLQQLERDKDVVIFKGSGNVFCAGGDVKQMSNAQKTGVVYAYTNGYRSVNLIANYKKPYVALMDGLAMGGAAHYSIPARHCVATERTLFAMPETALGYYNDSGSTYFLPRLANNFGKTNDDVSRILKNFSSDRESTATELDQFMPTIRKCFGGETVEKIYENLQDDGSDLAQNTINILNRMSPTSLKVVHRSLRIAKTLSLQDCLKMEFRLAIHHNVKSDLKEGARAVLIDKDSKPKWSRESIYDVTEEDVARFFQPLPAEDELLL